MALVRTLKVSSETLRRLAALKVHPREPYNDVIRRLMAVHQNVGESTGTARESHDGQIVPRLRGPGRIDRREGTE